MEQVKEVLPGRYELAGGFDVQGLRIGSVRMSIMLLLFWSRATFAKPKASKANKEDPEMISQQKSHTALCSLVRTLSSTLELIMPFCDDNIYSLRRE
ncbi:MAG: hypothetical protein DRP82_02525 [Planctomycetota bacterium]|nr:MAG: hypothetical protein DRP82_02525 [Planctomycetota bacterium]